MNHFAVIQLDFIKTAREWDELSLDEQRKYLSKHPKSKKRLTAKKSKSKTIDVNAYHVTNKKNAASILKNGLKVNSPHYMTMGGTWAKDVYGVNPIYLSSSPAKTSKQKLLSGSDVALRINTKGLNLVADLPSLVDHGAYMSDISNSFYWKEGQEPEQLKEYLDENGELSFDQLVDPNSPVAQAAIQLTGSAAVLQDIAPDRIKL